MERKFITAAITILSSMILFMSPAYANIGNGHGGGNEFKMGYKGDQGFVQAFNNGHFYSNFWQNRREHDHDNDKFHNPWRHNDHFRPGHRHGGGCSHKNNVAPEPVSALLFLTGAGAIAALRGQVHRKHLDDKIG